MLCRGIDQNKNCVLDCLSAGHDNKNMLRPQIRNIVYMSKYHSCPSAVSTGGYHGDENR